MMKKNKTNVCVNVELKILKIFQIIIKKYFRIVKTLHGIK